MTNRDVVQNKILIDDRERASGLLVYLRQHELVPEIMRLSCGDIIVGSFLIERKTIGDLMKSLSDGRFTRQLLALRRSSLCPVLLIEGSASAELSSIAPGLIRQISLLSLTRFRIPVIRSRDTQDTAFVIWWLSKHSHRTLSAPSAKVLGKKPRGIKAQRLFILSSIPGVGLKRARSLLRHFGTLRGVFSASRESLLEAEDIGDKQAKRIVDILDSG